MNHLSHFVLFYHLCIFDIYKCSHCDCNFYIVFFLVEHFYHEPLAREIGRPLPMPPTLNKFCIVLVHIAPKDLRKKNMQRMSSDYLSSLSSPLNLTLPITSNTKRIFSLHNDFLRGSRAVYGWTYLYI